MSSTTTKSHKSKLPENLKKSYPKDEVDKAVEALITARIKMLVHHPFFGNLATRLLLVDASEWLDTLATDGRHFYFNVGFVNKLTLNQNVFGFAHEVLHNVFDHMGRVDSRDKQIANIAMDFAVNQITKDEKIGEFPTIIDVYQNNKYRGWSFEEIYEDIMQNSQKISIMTSGSCLDEHLDPSKGEAPADGSDEENDGKKGPIVLSPEDLKAIRDELKEAMIQAAHAAGADRVPADIARMILDLTEPQMDWRELLRLNIQSILKSDFSFARVNRKSQMCGAVLPGMLNEETIDVAVAVDMSGSITDKQALEFVSEVKGIMDEFTDFNLKLWCFDTRVYQYAEFTQDNADDILEYKARGGGGTDFEVNWKFMKGQQIEPKRFIMFTDGLPCGGWGDSEYCETLFIIHGSKTIVPPFGQFAYFD